MSEGTLYGRHEGSMGVDSTEEISSQNHTGKTNEQAITKAIMANFIVFMVVIFK